MNIHLMELLKLHREDIKDQDGFVQPRKQGASRIKVPTSLEVYLNGVPLNKKKSRHMKQNEIKNILFNKATEFIIKRYPKGWGGAAILRTDQNNYLISVALETCNAGASLCIETGAICEAHKIDERVTHSVCIVRENEESPFKVLTPCGICQERLMYWDNVLVGVTTQDSSLKLISLNELQPFHWTNAYNRKELEFYANK